MKSGLELIKEERKRQIEVEGWTPEHDSQYTNGELFNAGCCYYGAKRTRAITGKTDYGVPMGWPWVVEWWKPTPDNRIKELVKAGALFQADFDLNGSTFVLKYRDMCADEIDKIQNELTKKQ